MFSNEIRERAVATCPKMANSKASWERVYDSSFRLWERRTSWAEKLGAMAG